MAPGEKKTLTGNVSRYESTELLLTQSQAANWENVEEIRAYLPEPFGTHHTKMMVLFRSEGSAQVIVTTANMIPFDYGVMTQAVWKSPILPLTDGPTSLPVAPGTGIHFGKDLLDYLRAYGSKLASLVKRLEKHDFSAVKAALVASVPSKRPLSSAKTVPAWGWPKLREVIRMVPTASASGKPVVVMQVSSIASLGAKDEWFQNLCKSFAPTAGLQTSTHTPGYRIIFPTADAIRRSVAGYRSGSSIHTPNNTTPTQKKQLDYLRPKMCHWAGDGPKIPQPSGPMREAGRRRAAPHIKTYVRFASASADTIDWAMVTSANLSKQAWGELPNSRGEVRISSFELGVVVWPALFAEEGEVATMAPCFKQNSPPQDAATAGTLVGFRMPYDLPLVPYAAGEVPWCNKVEHEEVDWQGEKWEL